MMVCFLLVVLAILLLLGGMVWRALRFRPQPLSQQRPEALPVDRDRAVAHLQAMVRCRTISTPEFREEAEFERFRDLLPEFYPRLFAAATVRRVDTTGVLIRLPGREMGNPAVLLGHYDVVPAQEELWEKPPFAGILEGDTLWGRGTLDMKNQLCCMLEAMETLLESGFVPRHDIYFALSGEEEIMGPSARSMRDVLQAEGITPAFVLDEGGDILDGFFPGAPVPCAMVGIGEKGPVNLRFVARCPGGHASVPREDNPLPRLCRAMERISRRPFPQRSSPALEATVETMGRYCPFSTRLLLANRGLLRPLYRRWLRKQGGMLSAASRTTLCLTGAQGSSAYNVIPPEAAISANLRLLWGDSLAWVLRRLKKIIRDPGIELQVVSSTPPSQDSTMTAGFSALKSAIEATWPQAVVTPYLMVASTDSRYWREICDNVYRFSGKYVTGAEKATVHGTNERIRIENTENAVRFFLRLLREC